MTNYSIVKKKSTFGANSFTSEFFWNT